MESFLRESQHNCPDILLDSVSSKIFVKYKTNEFCNHILNIHQHEVWLGAKTKKYITFLCLSIITKYTFRKGRRT